jgi:hypothetical protein
MNQQTIPTKLNIVKPEPQKDMPYVIKTTGFLTIIPKKPEPCPASTCR